MLESQIEIVSPGFKHMAEASLLMGELRRALASAADMHDLRLIAAARIHSESGTSSA